MRDLQSGHGISVNAGHENPCLCRAGGQYEAITYEHDLILGAMPTMTPYVEREFTLAPGDSLFVYTDGVAEAKNGADELFGEERLLSALNRTPQRSPEETVKGISAAIRDFAGGAEQFDDITMLAFSYAGPKEKEGEA